MQRVVAVFERAEEIGDVGVTHRFAGIVGDQVLFLRKAAIEIQFAGESYLIVPHGAILVLARDDEAVENVDFREGDFEL